MGANARIWNPNFMKVFFINLFNAIGFHVLTPILPKYAVSLGYSGAAAGMIGTAFTITAILVRCFTGVLSSEKRQRGILIAALLLISVASSGYAMNKSTNALVAFRLLHGVGWGVATTLIATMAVRTLPQNKIGSGFGMFGLASVVGQAIAPNLGLSLVVAIGYPRTFLIAMVLPAVAVLLCLTLRFENGASDAPKPARNVLAAYSPNVLTPSILIFLVTMGVSCVSYFLALCAESRGMQGVGYFFTIYAFSLFFIRPTFGRLADRFTKRKIFLPCACALIISLLLIALTNNMAVWYLTAVLYGIGYGGVQPALQAWCVQSVPREQSAFANSSFYSFFDLGMCLGSIIGGAISDKMSYGAMYMWMCAPLIVAIVLAFVLRPQVKQIKEEITCQ